MKIRILYIILLIKNLSSFAQYCAPVVSDNGSVAVGDSVGIINVTLGSINNNSAAKMGYENFTNLSTTLAKGKQYAISLTGGYTNQNACAWIDYNQDNAFVGFLTPGDEAAGIHIFGFPALTPTNLSTFTVPMTAKTGTTRLRISSNENGFFSLLAENCGDILTGDVEEYTVNIIDTFYINVYQFTGPCVNPGSINQNILLVEVISTDSNNIFNATTFNFNTNGSSNPAGDILNAKLWYTDTIKSFDCATKTLFGTINTPNGGFAINGSQGLPIGGKPGYFWLTYDVSPGATIGNVIDAECLSVTINPNTFNTPTPTAISGNRAISNSSFYQNREANIWYVTKGHGIDFNCTPPAHITNPSPDFQPSEGTASMCDKNGNLLFYTDGIRVFDRCHNQMPNGFGLSGSQSSINAALIVPKPGTTNRYYIFNTNQGTGNIGPTIDPNAGGVLVVSEVDMNLNSGMGDIITATKNDTILRNAVSEVVTAVLHCNKKDIWVMAAKHGTYDFYAYPITSAGIQTPVVSNVPWGIIEMHIKGTLKFSPNGKRIIYNPIYRSVPCCSQGRPVLLDFDNTTGVVSNPQVLTQQDGGAASFSNDNTKLYVGNLSNQNIYQYDLCTGPLTRVSIGSNPGSLWMMQNAPDGKIYTNRNNTGSDFLGVINSPNAAAAATNFVANGFQLSGSGTTGGLAFDFNSAFLESYFNSSVFTNANTGFTNTTVCFGDSTAFTDTSSALPGCISQARIFKWYFGDPTTGSADTSYLQHPKHLYSSAGTFTVTQIIEEGCESDTIIKTIIVDPTPIATVTGTDSICMGSSTTLTASGGNSYLWNSGNTANIISPSPSTNSVYTVTATIGNCTDTTSFTVYTKPSPTASISATSISICEGDNVSLTASGGTSFVWNTGNTSSVINITPTSSTTYTLIAGLGTCFDTTQINITVNSKPLADAGNNDTICEGNIALLNASGGTTYSWSNGSSNASVNVNPLTTSTYTLIAFNGLCSDTDMVTIVVNPTPVVNAGNNITVIHGESAILSASGGTNYSWTPATGLSCTNCPNPTVTPTETTTYYVTVIDSNGCYNLDSITVTIDFKCGFYIPNAFSPNGDGQNDFFEIQSNCIEFLNLKIYDRWGELVFETFSQTNRWDGNYKGKELNTDVFVYKVIAHLINGEEIVKSGNISLIR